MIARNNGDAHFSDDSLSSFTAFSRLRAYPGFSDRDLESILRADLNRAEEQGGLVDVFEIGGCPAILSAIYRLDWDSLNFGIPMYRLIMARSDQRPINEENHDLNKFILSMVSRFDDARHVSVEVDGEDIVLLNALVAAGFRVMDVRRTYCANRMREDIDFIRHSSRVREFQPSDEDAVAALVRETQFDSRFSRDPYLPQGCTARMYQSWFRKLMTGAGIDSRVLVFERDGRVVAAGGIGEIDFTYAGVDRKMRSGSLYAGSKRSVGAYPALLYRLIQDSIQSHGLVETTASISNATVCRIIEAFRSYKAARFAYSLRLWRG